MPGRNRLAGPGFLGIGSQKAGTTWLHRNLVGHPEIWMPPTKTIRYFNEPKTMPLALRALGREREDQRWRRYVRVRAKKLVRRKPDLHLRWNLRYCLLPRTDRWYLSLFQPGPGQISGEVTPAYCRMPREVVRRIHALLPDTKIIYVLRNPIDRIWSHAAMRFGKLGRPLDQVDDDELNRFLASRAATAYSDVVSILDVWQEVYPPEQLFLGLFDELSEDPSAFLRRILVFLEVDSSERRVPPSVGAKRRQGSYNSMPERFRRSLSRRYHPQLAELHRRFDHPITERWLRHAEEWLPGTVVGVSSPPR